MSWLDDLVGKAKGFLGKTPKPIDKATDAVRHDRFDDAIFQELLDEAPALADMVSELNDEYDYTEDMVRDVLMEFWQGDPRLRSAEEMRPGWLTNHAVANHITTCPDTEQTRSYTVHDKYGAAMATIAVQNRVKEFLENRTDVQEAAEEAQQAEEDLQQSEDGLAQALAAAEQVIWPEIGPPSPEAQAAAQALADALAECEDKAGCYTDAADQAQQVAAQAAQALRTPVQQAVQEAGEMLEEEQSLFAAWGVDPGTVERMSFRERAELAARLRGMELSKYSQLLGRFKLLMHGMRTKKTEYGRDEMVGVELGDDLSRLVGKEFVYLASKNSALRLDFYRRLFQQQLNIREYRGTELVGQGAIICAFDTSGSMKTADDNGIPREAWAKAFVLALLDQAKISNRDFVGISFASTHQQKMWEFPKGHGPVEDVIAMTEHFFNGGTNYENPLTIATDKLEREFNADGKAKGDIVFITDDDCGISTDYMRSFLARKERLGFRIFGIKVGKSRGYGAGLEAISDNVRIVDDFVDPASVGDIFKVLG